MLYEIIGPITEIETIASGCGVRDQQRLRERFGGRRWRKIKGIASVRLDSGRIHRVELHWYEAHGIGKRLMKIKRFLD